MLLNGLPGKIETIKTTGKGGIQLTVVIPKDFAPEDIFTWYGKDVLVKEQAVALPKLPMEEGKKEYKIKEKTETPAFFIPPDCKRGTAVSCEALPGLCQDRYLCCLQCIDPCIVDRCKEAKARVQG